MKDTVNTLKEITAVMDFQGKTQSDIEYGYVYIQKFVKGEYVDTVIYDSRDGKWFRSIEYNAGYGGQELFGTIVFNDDSWLERDEYDGSENWIIKKLPEATDVFPKSQNQKDYEEGEQQVKWLLENNISISALLERLEINAIDDNCTRSYCDGFKSAVKQHILNQIKENK